MSRKRIIDVDKLLFDDELVEALGPEGLWVYPLLWGLAEDWGGYEPKYGMIALKSGALRLTKESVQRAIEALIRMGKVIPYEANGHTYHWIKNLLKHQTLNNPPPPGIPTPPWIKWEEGRHRSGKKYAKYSILQEKIPENSGSLPVAYQYLTGSLPVITDDAGETRETDDNPNGHLTSTPTAEAAKHMSGDNCPNLQENPSVDYRYSTGSLPVALETETETETRDSIFPNGNISRRTSRRPLCASGLTGKKSSRKLGKKLSFSANDLGKLWNETAHPALPRVLLPLSKSRINKFRPALTEHQEPEWWKALFVKAGGIPGLRGENERGWRADLEFVVRRRTEILEGKYDSWGTAIGNVDGVQAWLKKKREEKAHG
ncbi:MAG: hypothetical protein QME75_16120 [Deltaproteobacteria bacterium]|nr:hypothetical protein [Deltaproteobacteria bacterium]